VTAPSLLPASDLGPTVEDRTISAAIVKRPYDVLAVRCADRLECVGRANVPY
jgi:hypothetical protein